MAFIAAALFCQAAPASALFEDNPAGARQAALGGAVSAVEDCAGFFSNPALGGACRKFSTGAGFLSSERVPQGDAEFSQAAAWMAFPYGSYGKSGTFSLAGISRRDGETLTEVSAVMSWSSWQLIRLGDGSLDFGTSLKVLRLKAEGGDTPSGAGLDLGAAYRPDGRRTLALSVLNLNRPSFEYGTAAEKAPVAVHAGYSERLDDLILSVDIAGRSGAGGSDGNYSLTPGVEYLWRTLASGSFYTRAGLNLAHRASALGAGIGWRRQAAEISYGLSVPLTGAVVPAHSVSLTLRFGDRDVESEYERLVRQEMKYRKDLSEALDDAAAREIKLKAELASMKEEIDALSLRLSSSEQKREAAGAEKARLEGVMRRQASAEAELRAMSEKRRADKLAQVAQDFEGDWQTYLKLKNGGAPREVLKGALERLVGRFQDSGIDISRASMELREQVKGL